MGTARFTLTLSPEKYRGFSGEGALLGLLADEDVAADARAARARHSAGTSRIDVEPPAATARLSLAAACSAALGYLAASGRVGYDLAEQSFFRRELPFGPALEAMHPRPGQRAGTDRIRSRRPVCAGGAVVAQCG